jgi:hypothetical protein
MSIGSESALARLLAPVIATGLLVLPASSSGSRGQDPATKADAQDPELAKLVADELRQDELALRRGAVRKAVRSLEEILGEDEGNAGARLLLARARLDAADYPRALEEATRALAGAGADRGLARA